jgi:hypothetical protein
MRPHTIQSSFVAGMLDGPASARSETALYRNGARVIHNGLPMATGGILSRWGSQHLATFDAGTYRLEEFSFSLDQSYMLVFYGGAFNAYYADDGSPAGGGGGAPWSAAQIPELRFAQAGDTMFITHPAFPTVVLKRTGSATWVLSSLVYTLGIGPVFRYEAGSNACLTSGNDVSFSIGFLTADYVGTILRIYDKTASVYRYASIVSVTSDILCTVDWFTTAVTTANSTYAWEEQAFSTTRGWARSCCIYQQRLILGGSRDAGDAVWMSRLARYTDFDLGTAADTDAVAISLGTTKVRTIQHTVAGPQLTFLTENAALYVPESDTRAITPASLPKVRVISAVGAGNVRPGNFDGGVLMVQSSGNSVRDIAYSTEADNLVADPVSLTVTDTLGTLIDAAYLPGSIDRPEQYAFFVTADGRIMVFHSIREQKITAWGEWVTAGRYLAVGHSAGRLFAIVLRSGAVHFEMFDSALCFDGSLIDNQPFVAPHLAGLIVHARLADDYFGSGLANGSGAFAVTREDATAGGLPAGQLAEIGLGFDFYIEPLPPSMDLPDGTIMGRVQRLLRVGVRLYQARAASIADVRLVLLGQEYQPGEAPAAFDGWWTVTLAGFARRDDPAALCPRIGRSVPMPVGVLAMRREIALWA